MGSSSKFASKGITLTGKCPAPYNTLDKSVVVQQCPDGVTSIRYCSPINVTIDTKGQAMMSAVEGTSAYCQIEPDKKPPYFCHAPAEPINCKTDSDCVTPWYNSFCMNDATKKAPYLCKVELPPTCKSDKDCQRSVLSIEEAVEDEFYLHAVDVEDHKCFEASSSSKFASKGITSTGKCPASYNTVDKSVVVEQCPDGVTSIRYCSSINVTIDTKGEAMVAEVVDKAQCSKDTDCPSSYCNNGFCHGCFDKCCQTTSDCTKKGLGYCQNDSTKMPPYFCHA